MTAPPNSEVTVHRSVHAGRRRHRARRTAALAPALGLLTALVSCTSQPDPLTTPCGVVVDGSGSGASNEKGFDAEAKLKSTLLPFLEEQGCGTVEFAPITRSSQSSSCRVERVDLDPPHKETTDQKSLRARARTTAAGRALEELECARTQGGSDVWGALDRIGEEMPPKGPAAKLLVVSDFAQTDPDFRISRADLSTARQREETIDSLVEERGIPAIKGMDIYPVGLGMQYDSRPGEAEDFQAFWTEVLEGRARARVHHDYK
ncbi:hypothetical protein [Streptomyces barkulensis]|uniref:hypothetical protein n=1 Tax=Streptomyces barkulensis TaxID=1257026 RepID=UPI000C6ED2EA|nr:hypothetical protein [Streptomyces barkulensis]